MNPWQGRVDEEDGAAALRWHQVVTPFDVATAADRVVLAGFACDAGVARNGGRPGAAGGPGALRRALANMPVHECRDIADAGDVTCEGDELEPAQWRFAKRIATILDAGGFPVGLGGGHEMAWGTFLGLAQHIDHGGKGGARVGIVNFDAHFDLRNGARANSGTPFRQIAENCAARGRPFNYCCVGISRYANTRALFERAEHLQVRCLLDEELTADHLVAARQSVGEFIARVDCVYLTVCLDVLPVSVAPGVSAPAARGVGLEIIEPLVDAVVGSGKVRLADVAELNPLHDIDDRTARVAARLVARIANGWVDRH